MTRVAALAFATVALAQVQGAPAFASGCDRPEALIVPSAIAAQAELNSWERKVKSHMSALDRYVQCLERERDNVRREQGDLIKDWNETALRFNEAR